MANAASSVRLKWQQVVPRQYSLIDCDSGEQLGQVYGIVGACNRPTGSWRHTLGERKFGSLKAAADALLRKVADGIA